MNKTHFRLLAVIMLPLLLITFSSQKSSAQDASVSYQSDGISYQSFYDQLAPYGQWVNDPQYGSVWVPDVPMGFKPYASDGHWVMTDQGNMWFSDEPWAWAAYHYGRWTYNPYYGWVWIPGYEWAPAWVSWRTGGGYYGWAPLGPGQRYGRYYDYPDNYWVFVNPNYLYNPYVYNYYERGDMGMYVRRTEYVRYEDRDREYGGRRRGDRYYEGDRDREGGAPRYYGPRREDIERETGQPVQVYRVSNARSAGEGRMGGNEVNIYRPPVNRESEHNSHPSNVIEGRDHPIGHRQEPVAPTHETAPPAFRQEHPQQPDRQQPSQQQPPREQPQPQQHQQFQQPPQREQPQPQQHQQLEQPPQREQPQPQQHQQLQQPPQREQPQPHGAPQQQQRQQPQPRQHGAPQQQQRQQPQPQQQKGQQRGGQQRTKPQQQSERK